MLGMQSFVLGAGSTESADEFEFRVSVLPEHNLCEKAMSSPSLNAMSECMAGVSQQASKWGIRGRGLTRRYNRIQRAQPHASSALR